MKEKVDLAAQMMENKLLPTDWIYENLFHLSEDQYDEQRDLIREDTKRAFRLSQIEEEGNDPVATGKSYGTPHDLASLYGQGRMASDPGNVPDGYNEDATLGRPKEKVSNINTQDNAFGKDRLGKKGAKSDYNSSDSIKPNFKGGSPLALETMLSKIPMSKKQLVFEQDSKEESLLNEDNIKEQKS